MIDINWHISIPWNRLRMVRLLYEMWKWTSVKNCLILRIIIFIWVVDLKLLKKLSKKNNKIKLNYIKRKQKRDKRLDMTWAGDVFFLNNALAVTPDCTLVSGATVNVGVVVDETCLKLLRLTVPARSRVVASIGRGR